MTEITQVDINELLAASPGISPIVVKDARYQKLFTFSLLISGLVIVCVVIFYCQLRKQEEPHDK